MQKSIKEKSKLNDSGLKSEHHTTAANDREAFKDEARRIRQDNGIGKGYERNYNKRNSPGEKYLRQDGEIGRAHV